MDHEDERWVEKIHPATRELAAEDPMELVAAPVSGDPEVMLECLLQEFLWLGCDADQLVSLFHSPAYPMLVEFREHFGEQAVRERVENLVNRWGVLQFRETIADPDEDADEEQDWPQLVQLSWPIWTRS